MHRLLRRQLVEHLGPGAGADPALQPFLTAVDAAYRQADHDRAMLERSLALTSDELLERNAELRKDLEEIRRLEVEVRHADKLRAVSQLAAGIAHELNTPIQYIGDSLQFMEEAYDALLALRPLWERLCADVARGATARPSLTSLEQQAEQADIPYYLDALRSAFSRTRDGLARVAHIVGALGQFAPAQPDEKVLSDLNGCLLSTLAVAAPQLNAVAEVEVALGAVPPLSCYPAQLNQVFLHLLTNAAQACEARERPSGDKGHVRVSTTAEGATAMVVISDDGCGISPEHMDRVFEPFFTTWPDGKGTGQGLALSHVIVVERHGGSLAFTSEVGRGTTFYVHLPLDRE